LIYVEEGGIAVSVMLIVSDMKLTSYHKVWSDAEKENRV
jgi:hypothetical protein